MLGQTSTRNAEATSVGAGYRNDRSRMFFALVLLLVALVVVVINDRDFWFGDPPASLADETTPEWVPNTVLQAPVATAIPAVKATKPVVATKSSTRPTTVEKPVTVVRNVIPPLEVEVVAGSTHGTVRLSSNTPRVETPLQSRFEAAGSAAAAQRPATVAAERITLAKASVPSSLEPAYPMLGRQMKVQGSVLLQAFIGADGTIQDLRVLSGPAILASAAREAARQWQFKPYMQNGRPVETQAKITVNFTIKVLENGARDQMDTVVALSRGGE